MKKSIMAAILLFGSAMIMTGCSGSDSDISVNVNGEKVETSLSGSVNYEGENVDVKVKNGKVSVDIK